jgi:hypothetical protein
VLSFLNLEDEKIMFIFVVAQSSFIPCEMHMIGDPFYSYNFLLWGAKVNMFWINLRQKLYTINLFLSDTCL